MKRKRLCFLLLPWACSAFALTAQPAPTFVTEKAEDPLLVAAQLSRQLEGKAAPQDKVLTLEQCLAEVLLKNPTIAAQKPLIEQALGENSIFARSLFHRSA